MDAGPDAGLDAGTELDAGPDAGVDAGIDAGPDAGIDAGPDAGPDAGIDAGPDAGIDAGPDAGIDAGADAGIDAGPELDGGLPPGCTTDTVNYIFTFGADGALYRFSPTTISFELVGYLDCPDPGGFPNSMAVERGGQAWVIYTDGNLFGVDTTTATCSTTSWTPAQNGFIRFGMGYSSNTAGSAEETLYVSAEDAQLGSIDTNNFTLTVIGSYLGLPGGLTGRAEMTGTGDGRLFGLFEGQPFVIAEINKLDARILSAAPQSGVDTGPNGSSSFCYSYWGGQFWMFVGPGDGTTSIYVYDPATGNTALQAVVLVEIVGAGASTCAPGMKEAPHGHD